VKIMINALSARLGGGQTYLINLLRRFPSQGTEQCYVLGPRSLQETIGQAGLQWLSPGWPLENPIVRALWERFFLPRILRRLGIDILFCPGGVVTTPVPSGCKVVTMFRNMIPFDRVQRKRYPLGYMRVRIWLLERVMLRSMLRADVVIFVSDFARRVIEQRVPECIKRAVVIPHGVGPEFRVGSVRAQRPGWLPAGDYLLYVSTFDVYKAQLEVVRGFSLLKARRGGTERLVLVGSERQNPNYSSKVRAEIMRLGLEKDVNIVGLVPYQELPGVYQNALINIFAAESENCPNILLEAMAAGRPVVSSNFSPMPEFGGDAVVYFNPQEPQDFADKVGKILDDPSVLRAFGQRAAERALRYDWEAAAATTWQTIFGVAA
jgi:glycosyltransferase involved in cell wall biosynthesis